jgi:hypothetical protein
MNATDQQMDEPAAAERPSGPDVIGYTVTTAAGKSIGRVAATDPHGVLITKLGHREREASAVSWTYVAWLDPVAETVALIDEGAELLPAA